MTAAPSLQSDQARSGLAGERRADAGDTAPESALRGITGLRPRAGLTGLKRSPLARKIIIFNLIALLVLVSGALLLGGSRDNLVAQRLEELMREAQMIASVVASGQGAPAGAGIEAADHLAPDAGPWRDLAAAPGEQILLLDPVGRVIARKSGPAAVPPADAQPAMLSDMLDGMWRLATGLLSLATREDAPARADATLSDETAASLAGLAAAARAPVRQAEGGGKLLLAAAPVLHEGKLLGSIVIGTGGETIDALVRAGRERILQVFVVALFLSVGLSLVLAATIANPLSDLAAAAEIGRERDTAGSAAGRVSIPDLAARPDEIGRLSVAMRGMVAALYDRIDANEQFAADVAHEIKNPLASLRSAVGSLRLVARTDQREKLLDVIEHDVRRLDRLVSDISNASRLDSELVKEEEEEFDLLVMLANLARHLGQEAVAKGVDFITDLPAEPVVIRGLEARLAQVFVNLITNALSFCEAGDAVRVWVRRRDNRVLAVVEDTGPGIPEAALTKVFRRFYSERPQGDFGNHSGLGLAISKQIVEAHGGVIWAENIRPTAADETSDPLGARFVVGLPV